jgi:hypothetical protein
MITRKLALALVLLFPVLVCRGQDEQYVTTPEDRALAETILTDLQKQRRGTDGDRMVRAAEALLGQPYVAGTLEELPDEPLCIYLTRTDCILFVETCMALVRTAAQEGEFETLAWELRQSRYRNGRRTRYEDRLHYTTEWARQQVSRDVLKEMTGELGGVPFDHPVHYMSMHPDAYKRMTDAGAIAAIEERINAEPSTYIPKERLGDALKGIRNGDILLFTSTVDGLDIAHCGIAKVVAGQPVRFIHASSGAKKVLLEPRTLEEYVRDRKTISGLQVYRFR